jgi:hypothetical protein
MKVLIVVCAHALISSHSNICFILQFIFFIILLWLLSSTPTLSSSIVCPSLSQTYTTSITPASASLYIKALSSNYQDYNIIWAKSATNNIDVSAVVCSDDTTLVSSLLLTLSNKVDGVYLELDQVCAQWHIIIPSVIRAHSVSG